MTKIAVAGPASGTGTFTLTTPVSSTDRTLTLPDSTGMVLNDQSNIEAQVKTATNATGSAPIYSCRAWCNFNGTGTVAIRASGNVSSITDLGTGTYDVNFTTALPDANFAAVSSFQVPAWVDLQIITYEFYTTRYRIGIAVNTSGSGTDAGLISSAVFR